MTRIKICGIQKPSDALVAAEAGADFLGLVFVPGQRRRLDLDTAWRIVSGVRASSNPTPQMVGLFADQPLAEVARTIETCGLDLVQLCGHESPEYCRQVRIPVIKVLHVAGPAAEGPAINDLETRFLAYRDSVRLITLDRLAAGAPGGTGQSFDWAIAASLARRGHSFLLAGGLSPDNVAEAVATVQPWGVDVSSGVETGGSKDPDKIRAFIRNVRQDATSGHPWARSI
jgi:phosphoribosylanthranilate isomerase